MIIYMIINLITERAYIGQTRKALNTRLNEHFEDAQRYFSSAPLHEAMRKYPEHDIWDAVVLQNCYDQQQLDIAERYWIEYCNTRDGAIGYNVRIGGQSNSNYDEEKLWQRRITTSTNQINITTVNDDAVAQELLMLKMSDDEIDDFIVQHPYNKNMSPSDRQKFFKICGYKGLKRSKEKIRTRKDMSPEEIEKYRAAGHKGAEIRRKNMLEKKI